MTTFLRPRRAALGALAFALAAALTACAPSPEPAPTGSVAPPAPETPAPEEPTAEPVDPASVTCETLLVPSFAQALKEMGWSSKKEPFHLAGTELKDGLWCKWGDLSGPANANVQTFGWALLDAAESTRAQESLIAEGWRRDDAPEGIYVSQQVDAAAEPQEDGMTYLFGDGWVTVADHKKDLLLIQRPS